MIKVTNSENFTIKIFGFNFFTFFNHYIMKISLEKDFEDTTLKVEEINTENLSICENGDFSTQIMENYIVHQKKYAIGYLFYCEAHPIGYLWVMKKGGKEVQYKIDSIDAFLFDVCVFKTERGKGYSKKMLSYVCNRLKDEGINDLFLAVRRNNEIALKTYLKVGAEIVDHKRFIRFMKKNIPYYSL